MGRVEEFTLDIPFDQSPRTVYVYLPDSYDHTKKKYPVLYMFDGHNLFFDEVATYGKCWGIKDYLDKEGLDLVVIGQDCNHTGNRRLEEYLPLPEEKNSFHKSEHLKSEGDITAKWFAEDLKKECEKRYRIYKTREHLGIAGSSMGGLMSAYCIAKYNRIYSKAACVSSALFFCPEALSKLITENNIDPNTKIYLDLGSRESNSKKFMMQGISLMLETAYLFEQKGCSTYPHLVVDGTHSEASWETIFPLFLQYLYPELYEEKNGKAKI